MNLKAKIIGTIAIFALLIGVIAPAGAFAANKIVIKDNGAHSTNKVKIKAKKGKKPEVNQHNGSAVINLVGVYQNTGYNETNKNTGDGDVDNTSGNATSTVRNNTTTEGNEANIDLCGCGDPDNDVTIKDNGAHSTNIVRIVGGGGGTSVSQSNHALVINGVYVEQNTGWNSANQNTGSGAVDLDSGDATSTVNNTTNLGGNILNPAP